MADLLGNKRKRQLEPTISVALPQLPLVFPLMPVPVLSSTSGGTPNSSAAVAAPATSSSSSFNSSPIAPLSQPKVTSPSQAPSDSVSDVRPRIRDPLQEWHEKEEKALVEFILLYGKGDQWPATKDDKYWQSAAKFIHERTGMRLRTGVACRSRTTGSLRKSFASPKRAEEEMTTADKKRDEEIRSTAVECELHAKARAVLQEDILEMENVALPIQLVPNVGSVTADLEVRLMSQLFSNYASRLFGVSVPADFIPLALNGMKKLKDRDQPNAIYEFTKAMALL